MSGIQEILLVLVVIFLVLFMPRLIPAKRPQERQKNHTSVLLRLSGMLRLIILISLAWLIGCALYFKPWDGALVNFLGIGVAPVLFGWGILWVIAGFRPGKKTEG